MGKSKVIIGVAVVALAATILGFTECNRHRSPEERITHKMGHISSDLDLTEQQQGKLNDVKDEILRARGAIQNDHQELFHEVIAQFGNAQIDEATVLGLLDQHHALIKQAAPQVVARVSEFHEMLTPEQKAKAVEHLTWFKEKRMH